MLTRMCNDRNSHSLLVGMQNGAATLEDSLAVLTKHNLFIWSSNCTPWYLLKRAENLYMDAYSSLTHNWQNVEATKMSFVRWMDKWTVDILTMERYSTLKWNEPSSHEKTWRKLKYVLLSKRSQTGKGTYCMIPTIWHSEKGKTIETVKKISSW